MKKKYFLVSLICILVAVTAYLFATGSFSFRKNASCHIDLNTGWEFTYNNKWYPASVPGCIHTDLLHSGIISDPFFGTNEDSVQWVADREWIYKTHFDKKKIGKYSNASLVFEGLDTYSEIYLNGNKIYSTNNMFRKWEIPLNVNSLKDKDNELLVKILPSKQIDSINAARLSYKIPDNRAFSRKSPYQSGWDWGPTLVTCGIWQPVYIDLWNGIKVSDLQIYQKKITDSVALINVSVKVLADANYDANLECKINGKKVNTVEKVHLQKGINGVSFNCKIDKPLLWWPNGMGDQNMYEFAVKVRVNKYKDIVKRQIGLRTVVLDRSLDVYGSKFQFIVNGVKMFAKGVNYIPPESFITSMTDEKYSELITSCKESNMNMIRVWGGGQYENDEFYKQCDKNGILVWQDFMFACALYPADSLMTQNIKDEVIYQIERIRNHPSLALWCGNNEVKNGWEDWGWQDFYSTHQRDNISDDYNKIFLKVIPDAVHVYDEGRPYVSSSPEWGWGHPECITEGDSHYWGVWWGEEPFEIWNEKTGRFMSEYGFQSYPQISTIDSFTNKNERFLFSQSLLKHQKNARGNEIITNSMNRYFGVPKDIDNFVYVSQLLQAYGIGNAIEAHRLKMPYCMGTLYWQLNDCWPVVSWSSIDYYGNWKALQYTVAKLYEPFIVATEMHSDSAYIYLVSDLRKDTTGTLYINVIDFNGKSLRKDMIKNLTALHDTSSLICIYPVRNDFMAQKDDLYLDISFVNGQNQAIGTKILYLDYPKNLHLPDVDIKMNIVKENEKCSITMRTDKLVKGMYIYTEPYVVGKYSDNYFDLLPGEQKTITFVPKDGRNLKNIQFKVKTYNNVF